MFRSVLFLNGTLPELKDLPSLDDVTTLAADGAYQRLLAAGHCAHVVVGDGDSLSHQDVSLATKVIIDTDQETTDFEKCLNYLVEHQLGPTLVCGISGGDLDHQHNNLNTFMKYAPSHQMCFLHTHEGAQWQLGFSVQHTFRATAEPGAICSILAFPEARLSTRGLQWPLTNEVLSMLGRSGARNRVSDARVEIDVFEGQVLVVLGTSGLAGCDAPAEALGFSARI